MSTQEGAHDGERTSSSATALLLIDTQVDLLDGAYEEDAIVARIADLLGRARATGAPVIFMQHDGDAGDSLEPESDGWRIHPDIAPESGERVLRKRTSDSFFETPLDVELHALGVTRLAIVGLRSERCIDTTSRRATTLGYDVTLVSDAHTTCDNSVLTAAQIIAHHNETLDDYGTDDHVVILATAANVAF